MASKISLRMLRGSATPDISMMMRSYSYPPARRKERGVKIRYSSLPFFMTVLCHGGNISMTDTNDGRDRNQREADHKGAKVVANGDTIPM